MSSEQHKNALRTDYELFWYRIVKVLGQGNFGITYLAKDINLDRLVAIKEYLPGQLSMRESSLSVHPLSAEHEEDFKFGLERFISEARTLTKFEHPNLIRVFNVFEANNTAYMVMNYETGESLQQIIKRKKVFTEKELMKIILPLMNGLLKMHATGFIHRDIKPGNIFIRKDGSPVLLDFGSARQTMQANPLTLTNFVSPGYAPIEQYASKSDKQGPWTDIYGLAATVHKVITGSPPVNAIDRSETITHDDKDCYIPLSVVAKDKYSDKFLIALDHALAFRAQERPKNIDNWRQEFNVIEDDIETMPVTPDVENESTMKINPASVGTDVRTERIDNNTFQGNKQDTINIYEQDSGQTIIKALAGTNKKLIIYGTAIGILVFAGVIFSLIRPDTEEQTQTRIVDTDAGHREESTTVISNGIEPGTDQQLSQNEYTDDNGNKEIKRLLSMAEENINKLQLTSPKDDNAYDQFLQILAIDLDNEDAKNGLIRISDKYIAMAYGAMDKENFDKAGTYIKKAGEIWPDSTKIAAANETLQNKIKEKELSASTTQQSETQIDTITTTDTEEKPDGTLSGIKKWLKETAEKNKNVKKEETTSDKFIKSIGGGK